MLNLEYLDEETQDHHPEVFYKFLRRLHLLETDQESE